MTMRLPISRQGGPRQGVPEEERLPWLEPMAVPSARRRRPRFGLWLLLALVVLAAVAVAALWRRGETAGGVPGLIMAPSGPYKIKPPEAGGMTVEGAGYASYAASEGGDPRGRIDTSAVAEAPLVRPKGAAVAAPVADAPAPDAPAGAGTIQLGAFSTEAKANAAWKALAARFSFLEPLTPVIAPKAVAGGATLYRLRAAAGATAIAICGRMRVAGESCQVVG